MKTVDNEIRDLAINFIDKAKRTANRSSVGQPDAHAHRNTSSENSTEDAQLREWLVGRRSRHGSAR
jgi:hypothetical protein